MSADKFLLLNAAPLSRSPSLRSGHKHLALNGLNSLNALNGLNRLRLPREQEWSDDLGQFLGLLVRYVMTRSFDGQELRVLEQLNARRTDLFYEVAFRSVNQKSRAIEPLDERGNLPFGEHRR